MSTIPATEILELPYEDLVSKYGEKNLYEKSEYTYEVVCHYCNVDMDNFYKKIFEFLEKHVGDLPDDKLFFYIIYTDNWNKGIYDLVAEKTKIVTNNTYYWIMRGGITDSKFYQIIKKVDYTTLQDLRQIAHKSDLYFNKVLEKCTNSTKSDIFETMICYTKKINAILLYYLRNKDEIDLTPKTIVGATMLKGSGIIQEIAPNIKELDENTLGVLLNKGYAKLIPKGLPLVQLARSEYDKLKGTHKKFYKPYNEVENTECFVCMLEKDETLPEKKRDPPCPTESPTESTKGFYRGKKCIHWVHEDCLPAGHEFKCLCGKSF